MRRLQAARGASLTADGPDPDRPTPDHPTPDHPSRDRPGAEQPDDDPDRADAPARPRRARLLLAVALAVLTVDVVTKVLVVARLEGQEPVRLLGGALLLRVSRNSGAAFSFAQGYTVVFTLVAITVIVVILRVSARLRSVGWALSLGLLLGGATGNLVDRLLRAPGPGRGAVVDFLDFQVWPSFNVADSGIVVGGLLAVLLSLRGIDVDGSTTAGRGER